MGRQSRLKQSRQGSTKLPGLALDNVETPWSKLFLRLILPISERYATQEQAWAARNVSYHRWIVSCWIVDLKWKPPGYKLPRTRAVQGYRPLGEIFYYLLEFCIQCHPLMSEFYGDRWNAKYPNAWDWFEQVFDELLSVPESILNLGSGASANQHQAELNMIRDYENPYDCQKNPHCFWLFEIASQLAQRSKNFKRDYYLKYQEAKKAYIDSIRAGEWCVVRVDEKGVYYYQGQGLDKKRIAPSVYGSWLTSVC